MQGSNHIKQLKSLKMVPYAQLAALSPRKNASSNVPQAFSAPPFFGLKKIIHIAL